MVDIESHRIVDMIKSRDFKEVVKWLQGYPNLSVVTRDGSLTYKNAITKSHPNALQVSGRFHILKNLTSYCTDYLKKQLKNKVIADEILILKSKDNSTTNIKNYTIKQKYELINEQIELGVKGSTACKAISSRFKGL